MKTQKMLKILQGYISRASHPETVRVLTQLHDLMEDRYKDSLKLNPLRFSQHIGLYIFTYEIINLEQRLLIEEFRDLIMSKCEIKDKHWKEWNEIKKKGRG